MLVCVGSLFPLSLLRALGFTACSVNRDYGAPLIVVLFTVYVPSVA